MRICNGCCLFRRTTAGLAAATLGGERHRCAIASPTKFGADPMVVDDLDGYRHGKRDAVSKHQIQPGCEQ